jgi:hypothetical protein
LIPRLETVKTASTHPARVMDRPPETTPGGTSPRTFALNHARPKSSFQGCSRISDYELQGKLGEGTFGYGRPLCLSHSAMSSNGEANANDAAAVRSIALDHARRAPSSPSRRL